jgi:hypothetical protein
MQRTVPNFTELNKLSIFTSSIHKPQLNCLPLLLLCSYRPLNWLLMEEKRGLCTKFSTLVEINWSIASSVALWTSWRILKSCQCGVYASCCCFYLLDWGLYRNQLVWPILTLLIQLNMVHCITHSNYFLVCFMVHWTESPLPGSGVTA